MRPTTFMLPAAVLVTAALAAAAAGRQGPGATPALADPGGVAARVDRLVQVWQPTSDEHRLDEVGWAPDLCKALQLAKDHGRPVFLFAYSGSAFREHAICLQRC